jgi:chemotaxis response regulator CheB
MGRDNIVTGASAGGLEAVLALLGSLPKNPPAAIVVVIHAGLEAAGFLQQFGRR